MGKFLKVLLDLCFIRRVISLDAKNFSNTRLSKYEIKDPYLKFYFHYIYSHLELLEQSRISRLMEIIESSFHSYVAYTGFEEIARKQIIELADSSRLSFIPHYVGRIWNKKVEIDVAAINHSDKIILLGECKWTVKKVNEEALDHLIKKSRLLSKLKNYTVKYALFSKAAFTNTLIKRAQKDNILLFSGGTMKRIC